mgnify:CR=1 FL=1
MEVDELDYLGPAAFNTYTQVVRSAPDSAASTMGDSVASDLDLVSSYASDASLLNGSVARQSSASFEDLQGLGLASDAVV